MHPLVAAVLLGLAWIDALMHYAEFGPPDRQRRQARHAGGRERHSIVRTDRIRQAMFLKGPLKMRPGFLPACSAWL